MDLESIADVLDVYLADTLNRLGVPMGYHDLRVTVSDGGVFTVIVVCKSPDDLGANKLVPVLKYKYYAVTGDILKILRNAINEGDVILIKVIPIGLGEIRFVFQFVKVYLSLEYVPVEVVHLILEYVDKKDLGNVLESLTLHRYSDNIKRCLAPEGDQKSPEPKAQAFVL